MFLRSVWGLGVSLALVGCNGDSVVWAPVGPDVERDQWIDRPAWVSGDGYSHFVSEPSLVSTLRQPTPAPREPAEVILAPAALEGDHVYSLSRYSGLVITDASDPENLRVEGHYSLAGVPFELSVAGGIVLALVDVPGAGSCLRDSECEGGQRSKVALIDAREPSRPRMLAEQLLPGSLVQTYREDDVLYVVSRELVVCYECFGNFERRGTVTAIDLGDPLALGSLGQLDFPVTRPALRAYAFGEGRLYVATDGVELRVIELERGLQPGASVPLPEGVSSSWQLVEAAGVLRAWAVGLDGRSIISGIPEQQFRIGPMGELDPITPVTFSAEGEIIQPVFHGGQAFGLSQDGSRLFSFDLSDREAPLLVSSFALPAAAIGLLATSEGRLLAFGSGGSRGASVPVRLALIDVSELAQPVLLDAASVLPPSGHVSAGSMLPPRFDAATGLVHLPYGTFAVGRVQLIDVSAGRLESWLNTTSNPVAGRVYLPHGDHLLSVSELDIATHRAEGLVFDPISRMELAQPADAVRVLGDRLAVFAGQSLRLLSGAVLGDPTTAGGVDVSGALGLSSEPGSWERRVFRRDERAYVVHRQGPEKLPGGGEGPLALRVYGLDLSDPESVVAADSVSTDPLISGEEFSGVVQTESSLLVARARRLPRSSFSVPSSAGQYPVSEFSYDIIDVSDPAAPRLASRFAMPSEVAVGGINIFEPDASLDTSWGWQLGGNDPNGAVVDRDWVVSQHSEPTDDGRQRHYLDRLDVSDPSQPRLLPPVNIPGSVLSFDVETGALVTLETLRFTEGAKLPVDCNAQGYSGSFSYPPRKCTVVRRALNGLRVDGDVAVRQSQLVLDDSRRTLAFAVSGDQVFYVTEPLQPAVATLGAPAPVTVSGVGVSLERIRVKGGQFERWPSVDLSGQHSASPRSWTHFVARGERVFSVNETELGVVDFGTEPPTLSVHHLPVWGCPAFDVAGDTVYCARGKAGVHTVDLSAAR
jgi:hypothetical protein